MTLSLTLITHILFQSVVINEGGTVVGVGKGAICAIERYSLALVDYPDFEEVCACFVVERVQVEHATSAALEVELGVWLRSIEHLCAMRARSTHVSQWEAVRHVAWLAFKGTTFGKQAHQGYGDDKTEEHKLHQLYHNVEVGVETVTKTQIRVSLKEYVRLG